MWNQIAFGAFLVVVAAGLMWHHRRTHMLWGLDSLLDPTPPRSPGHESVPENSADSEHDRRFLQRRGQRRVLASLLIGIVGLAIAGGVLLESPRQIVAFWGCVLLLVLALIFLGLTDLWGTRRHVRAIHDAHRRATEQMRAELEAEIAALRSDGRTARYAAEQGAGPSAAQSAPSSDSPPLPPT